MIKGKDLDYIDFSDVSTGAVIPVITLGEILWIEFMEPHGLSACALACEPGVPANRITEIANGTRAFTAETALLLTRFSTIAKLWMNLQSAHSLEQAQRKSPVLT